MQSFTQAGEFTFWGKLRSSLWDNIIFYTSYLFIAVILIIYISLQPGLNLDFPKLKAIAAAASNTWGLFLLVFMMGYGLVEVPRILWLSSKRGYSLNQAYFKISKLWGERNDAEGSLEEILISVLSVEMKLDSDPALSRFRDQVDTIVHKVPTEMRERVKRRVRGVGDNLEDINESMLAKLHKQVMVALTAHYRTEAQWQHMVDTVYWLEDNHKNSSSNEKIFRSQSPGSTNLLRKLSPTVEWYVRCLVIPHMYTVSAVVACIMSIMVTWSEITFFSDSPTLSFFALFIESAAANNDYRWIEIISFLTICYMSLCTFFTVFKVRVLNYYYLASNHQSDSYTLLFSGALLSRITPALCLNFLSVIHMDSHVITRSSMETSYTRVMGHMDVISIIQDGFNIYFPILLIVLTLATYFSLGSRLLSILGFQQFLEQDDTTGEFVEEGKELIKREKRRRERLDQSSGSSRPRREISDNTYMNPRQRSVPEQNVIDIDNSVHVSDAVNEFNVNSSRNREPPRNLFDDL